MTAVVLDPRQRHWRYWYGLGRWQRKRHIQLIAEPLCRMCLLDGKVAVAVVADHIVHHGGDWNQFWLGKLQSLCQNCHESRKRVQATRATMYSFET